MVENFPIFQPKTRLVLNSEPKVFDDKSSEIQKHIPETSPSQCFFFMSRCRGVGSARQRKSIRPSPPQAENVFVFKKSVTLGARQTRDKQILRDKGATKKTSPPKQNKKKSHIFFLGRWVRWKMLIRLSSQSAYMQLKRKPIQVLQIEKLLQNGFFLRSCVLVEKNIFKKKRNFL